MVVSSFVCYAYLVMKSTATETAKDSRVPILIVAVRIRPTQYNTSSPLEWDDINK